ncbi:MAG: hypothetical protein ACYC1D_06835 [Acidimicrobiales bacterium]
MVMDNCPNETDVVVQSADSRSLVGPSSVGKDDEFIGHVEGVADGSEIGSSDVATGDLADKAWSQGLSEPEVVEQAPTAPAEGVRLKPGLKPETIGSLVVGHARDEVEEELKGFLPAPHRLASPVLESSWTGVQTELWPPLGEARSEVERLSVEAGAPGAILVEQGRAAVVKLVEDPKVAAECLWSDSWVEAHLAAEEESQRLRLKIAVEVESLRAEAQIDAQAAAEEEFRRIRHEIAVEAELLRAEAAAKAALLIERGKAAAAKLMEEAKVEAEVLVSHLRHEAVADIERLRGEIGYERQRLLGESRTEANTRALAILDNKAAGEAERLKPEALSGSNREGEPEVEAVARPPWPQHRRRPTRRQFIRRRLVAVVIVTASIGATVYAISRLDGRSRQSGTRGAVTLNIAGSHKKGTALSPPPPLVEPGGGQTLFPSHRLVAFYGLPADPVLGVLGDAPPEAMFVQLAQTAALYATPGTVVVPTYELIAFAAQTAPGPNGAYSAELPSSQIDSYLKAVQVHDGMLILDIQPGRASLLDEAKALKPWLVKPDVGLALDPEWELGPGQLPGTKIGHTTATEINQVSAWLQNLTIRNHLPQKLLMIHQFRPDMVLDKQAVTAAPDVAIVFNMDGFGSPAEKLSIYEMLAADPRWWLGYKLFYKRDQPLQTPAQVLALVPTPQVIDYG